jgi:hypothetical protein
MSAFDDLQSQLLESVARRAGSRLAPGGERPSRWRRFARPRRGLVLVAVPFVFAAAAAAAIVTQSGESPALALENRVLTLTGTGSATKGPCRILGGRHRAALSDEAPDRGITAVLPQLATAPRDPPAPRAVALAESDSGGAVLARTIREVDLPQGITLIVYVAHGQGPFTLVNPRRCLAARLATLARLRPGTHDPLRREVARKLERLPDTTPGVQSLSLHYSQGDVDGGGASFPLLPGERELPTGVLFSGDSCSAGGHCSPVHYGGIAGPTTAYLTVAPAPHAGRHNLGVRRRVAVIHGLFAFTLPNDVGPEIVTQRARDGRALATSPLDSRAIGQRPARAR